MLCWSDVVRSFKDFSFDFSKIFDLVNSGNTVETLRDKNLFIEIEKIKYPAEIILKPLNTKDFRGN